MLEQDRLRIAMLFVESTLTQVQVTAAAIPALEPSVFRTEDQNAELRRNLVRRLACAERRIRAAIALLREGKVPAQMMEPAG